MKNRGSITIYLAIILMGVILMVCTIAESARVGMVKTACVDYTDMAVESVMAGYARQLFKDYGILLVWEDVPATEQVSSYIQDNINMVDLEGGIMDEAFNFNNASLLKVEENAKEYATDDGGECFKKQVLSYMEYAAPAGAIKGLVNKFLKYSDESEEDTEEKSEVTDIVDSVDSKLFDLTDKINEQTKVLKNTEDLQKKRDEAYEKFEVLESVDENDKKHDSNVKKYLKKYDALSKTLRNSENDIEKLETLIAEYEDEKDCFLRENGYADTSDYIDENLEKLQDAKNTLEKEEGLGIAGFTDINNTNIDYVRQSLDMTDEVIKKLGTLTVNQATEEDKKNKSIFETANSLLANGVLSLVLDDVSDLSTNAISSTNLPSTNETEKTNDYSLIEAAEDKAALALYAGTKFGNYTAPGKDTCLKYEMEYIVGGKDTDKENLANTVEKLAALRNLTCAAALVADSKKMKEVQAVAASAATAFGMPFLEPVIKAVLIEAWSLAEAASDVRILLDGGKVSIVKKSGEWNTSLTNLSGGQGENKSGGVDYTTFLEILIMTQNSSNCAYREMDLIQVNIQKRYNPNFLMTECFGSIDVTADYNVEPIFTAIPFVIKALGSGGYSYGINACYEY